MIIQKNIFAVIELEMRKDNKEEKNIRFEVTIKNNLHFVRIKLNNKYWTEIQYGVKIGDLRFQERCYSVVPQNVYVMSFEHPINMANP